MKAALVEQARARGLSPSEFLRTALADSLSSGGNPVVAAPETPLPAPKARTRLSLRVSVEDRRAILAGARQARLTAGDFVAGLVAGVPAFTSGASRPEHLAALVASNAVMATLARNLGHPTALFRQGSFREAHEYGAVLDEIAQEVREHVRYASAVLADLRPRRAGTPTTRSSGSQRV